MIAPIKRFFGWSLVALFWALGSVKMILDWVGRSTIQDDFDQLVYERLPRWADWLFSTPWWAPCILGTALAAVMIWLNWPPRNDTGRGSSLVRSEKDNITPQEALALVSEQDLRNRPVQLDGKHFISCDMRGATIHYGGDNYKLTNCTLFGPDMDTKLVLTSIRALNTMQLIQVLDSNPNAKLLHETLLHLPKSG